MRFRSEPPPATEELPPKGAPLKRFAPGFAFNGEYTNAIDGYLEQRGARGNKDCVSNFRRRKKPSTNITVLLLQPWLQLVFLHHFLYTGIGTCRHRAVIIYQVDFSLFAQP
jgi:hypothetical protein